MSTQQLANAIGFEVSEVKDNSTGKLSFRQQSRLQRWGTVWGFYSVLFLGLGFWMLQRAMGAMDAADTFGIVYVVSTLLLPIVSLIVGAVYGYVAVRLMMFVPDIKMRDGAIEGEARRVKVDGQRVGIGMVTTSRRIDTSLETYGRVYFLDILPFMRPMLSAEAL